jgi:hypothetical protein
MRNYTLSSGANPPCVRLVASSGALKLLSKVFRSRSKVHSDCQAKLRMLMEFQFLEGKPVADCLHAERVQGTCTRGLKSMISLNFKWHGRLLSRSRTGNGIDAALGS